MGAEVQPISWALLLLGLMLWHAALCAPAERLFDNRLVYIVGVAITTVQFFVIGLAS